MNVFDLVAKLVLDSSEYDQGLDESAEKGQSFGDKLKSGLATGAKAAVAGVTALTTATIAAGTALVGATNDVAAHGDEIDKQSQMLGLSATAYQEWDHILQHSGSSISALTPAMKTLAAQVESGSEAFEALGMSQEQVASLSQEELFSATIEALQGMTDESERNALASELLGKSYMELQPLLNTSVEDTEAMRQAVHDLGGIMSDEMVANAAAYQDAMQDMNTAMTGVKNEIIGEFMPGIAEVMSGLTELFSGDSETGIGMITQGFQSMVDKVFEMMPEFINLASTLLTGFVTVLIENLPELVTAGTQLLLSLVQGILQQLPTLVSAVLQLIATVTGYIISNLPEILKMGIEVVKSLAEGLIENLPAVIDSITEILTALVDFILGDLPNIIMMGIEIIFALAQGLIDNLPAIITAMLNVLTSVLNSIIENLPQFIASGIELIAQIIAGLIQAIPDIIAALPEIFRAIIDAFANVDWLAIGGNIIDGIISGLGAAVQKLWDAAVAVAKKALNAIKSALGISSPSKVFRDQIGAMIPEGMAIGIEANTDDVEEAMDDLADITAQPFDNVTAAITPVGDNIGQSYGGIVINVYPREGQSEEEIAEYVMDKLNMQYAREARALA